MISPGALALCVVLAIGAVVSAARLAAGPGGASHLGGRSSDGAHLVMNTIMAAMLVLPATALPPTALRLLYATIAAVFAALVVLGLVRPDPARRLHRPAHVYHVIAASAMAWAVGLMPSGPPGSGHRHAMAGMTGMAGTSGMPDMAGMGPSAPEHLATPIPVAAWLLAGLFALDALGTLALLRRLADRAAVVPHVVMDLGMVCMLLPAWLLPAG